MHKLGLLLTGFSLLLISGCKEMSSLYLTQDRPEDIQQLLEHDQFARVRQLTGKYPTLDTPALQDLVRTQEATYEDNVIIRAQMLESENDLLGAVQLLSDSLQNIPNSNILRENRNRIEIERIERVRVNERQQLIARAEYILNQKTFYEQQNNLQSPNIIQRWENTRNDRESETLAAELRTHAEFAFKQQDLEITQQCLLLSKSLDNTHEIRKLQEKLEETQYLQQKVAQKQASLNKKNKKNRLRQRQAKETRKLLETTRRALQVDNLVVAHAAFSQIPSPANNSSDVNALREELDRAVSTRVAHLTSRGDSEYRADDVDTAIKTWSEAQELDPENQKLKKRLDRAVRVLARLEQLKQQQMK